MTLLVGILCADGIVVGTDSASTTATTTGMRTVSSSESQKLWPIGGNALWCGTGSVGAIQQMRHGLTTKYPKGVSAADPIVAMKDIGQSLRMSVGDRVRSVEEGPNVFRAEHGNSAAASLLACVIGKDPCLFEFSPACHGEMKTAAAPCVAMGSGQVTADPLLAFFNRVFWSEKRPTLGQARLVAAWTILHCIRMSPGGIGGDIQLGTVSIVNGKAVAETSAVDEHLEQAQALEGQMRGFFNPPPASVATPPPAMNTGQLQDLARDLSVPSTKKDSA